MSLMLEHVDSPYIRLTGLLYLRYACEPSLLWGWLEPYLYDEELVRVESNPGKDEVTVGKFARALLTEMNYHGTMLPRLPVSIARDIKVKLLQAEKIEDRAQKYMKDPMIMEHLCRIGCRIRALYGDEENPVTWYDGVVDRVITRDDETGTDFLRPKFVVTFTEYGNTETVTLGEVDMLSTSPGFNEEVLPHSEREGRRENYGSRGNDADSGKRWERGSRCEDYRGNLTSSHEWERKDQRRDWDDCYEQRCRYDEDQRRHGRGHDRRWARGYDDNDNRHRRRSRSRDRDTSFRADEKTKPAPEEQDLMAEVLRRERDSSIAKGKAYAARPATFKQSLSVKNSGKSEHEVRGDQARSQAHTSSTRVHDNAGNKEKGTAPSTNKEDKMGGVKKQRTAEDLAAIKEKKIKLMAKYG